MPTIDRDLRTVPSLEDDKKRQSPSVLAYQYQSGKVKEGWHCLDCRQLPHEIEYVSIDFTHNIVAATN